MSLVSIFHCWCRMDGLIFFVQNTCVDFMVKIPTSSSTVNNLRVETPQLTRHLYSSGLKSSIGLFAGLVINPAVLLCNT